MLHHKIAIRVSNPGLYTTAPQVCRIFTLGDQGALTGHFCQQNSSNAANPSALEIYLPNSMTPGSMATPSVSTWFTGNFAFDSGVMPIRSVVVARNPVSNLIIPKSIQPAVTGGENTNVLPVPDMLPYGPFATGRTAIAQWSSGTSYNVGDIAILNNRTYVCVGQDRNGANQNYEPDRYLGQYWDNATLEVNPVKASLNTAGFPELWRRDWNVMTDDTNPGQIPAAFAAANPSTDGLMFRNPLCDTTGTGKTGMFLGSAAYNGYRSDQMLLLRSMLAATNTLTLCSPNQNVIARRSTSLQATISGAAGVPVEVTATAISRSRLSPKFTPTITTARTIRMRPWV